MFGTKKLCLLLCGQSCLASWVWCLIDLYTEETEVILELPPDEGS